MAFLVVEGIDGSGKSTVLTALKDLLLSVGRDPLLLREPGSTALGERLRSVLLDPRTGELDPWTEVCLFTACRAEMVARVIRPALEAGRDVLLDRYLYSTVAYQGHGAGADPEMVAALNLQAVGGLLPALVVLLDLSPEEAGVRSGGVPDRMESRGRAFQERVRAGFLEQARRDPARWHVLDASRPPGELASQAWRRARGVLGLEG